jgi:hypothetical protein
MILIKSPREKQYLSQKNITPAIGRIGHILTIRSEELFSHTVADAQTRRGSKS